MTTTKDSDNLSQTVKDINAISTFLSNSQIQSIFPTITTTTTTSTSTPSPINPTTLILAPSAILQQAHTIFSVFSSSCSSSPISSITTLVLTGGIGHSTPHLYAAVLRHPEYHTLPTRLNPATTDLSGLSEAQVFFELFVHFYDGEKVMKEWRGGEGLTVLVEGQSTNCGANARFSRRLLEENAVVLGTGGQGTKGEDDVIVVQDPTMSLRTKASFEKVYEAEVSAGKVRFWTWPVFVPRVKVGNDGAGIVWDEDHMPSEVSVDGLWDMKRFYGLILGEVHRLRDDENGYGPLGKGFINHVDVPGEVESAWRRLSEELEFER